MEGGGDSIATRAALRQGMDTFLVPLNDAARDKGYSRKLVCRGPRGETFRAFCDAVSDAQDIVEVLLVDAEGPAGQPTRDHLEGPNRRRGRPSPTHGASDGGVVRRGSNKYLRIYGHGFQDPKEIRLKINRVRLF